MSGCNQKLVKFGIGGATRRFPIKVVAPSLQLRSGTTNIK